MSVNIEGYVSQTGAASGWYQNGRAVSAQEKEKDAPQPKADNAVKVSISQEGTLRAYQKTDPLKKISAGCCKRERKERYKAGKQAASALTETLMAVNCQGAGKKAESRGPGGNIRVSDEMRIPQGLLRNPL